MNVLGEMESNRPFAIYPRKIRRKIKKSLFFFVVFLAFLGGFFLRVSAGVYTYPPPDSLYPGFAATGYSVFQDLNGIWESENEKRFPVPFCTDDYEELTLWRDFFIKQKPNDTLYIYVQGLASDGAVFLNGRLLQLTRDPARDYLIPVWPELMTGQWNRVSIRLKKSLTRGAYFQNAYIGVTRPVYLLTKEKKSLSPIATLSFVLHSDSTTVYAPYSEKEGYSLPPERLRADLNQLRLMGVRSVYLPFFPPNELKKIFKEADMRYILTPDTPIAYYNYYPFIAARPFWFNDVRFKTIYWKSYENEAKNSATSKSVYLLLILLPIVLLTLWKLIDSYGFRFFSQALNRLNYQSEILVSNHFYRYGFYEITLTMRILLIASGAYFLLQLLPVKGDTFARLAFHKLQGRWLFDEVAGVISIDYTYFLYILGFIGVWYFIKQILWRFSGFLFHLKDPALKINLIELQAEGVTLWAFNLYAFGWLTIAGANAQGALWGVGALLFIHILRKCIITYLAFREALRVSLIGNILYICVVEFLPWGFIL